MILSEKHYEAMKYMLEGCSISDISKLCKVSRTAIYNWLDDKEFKEELSKQGEAIKTNADKQITSKLDCYISEMHRIATTGKTDKERRSACEYMIDRVLGKATTKVADVTEEVNKGDVENIDDMIKSLNKSVS